VQLTLFSAPGCMRCKIVKSYMDDNGLNFQEFDFKSDGKDEFNAFYRKNRADIFRGKEGVEFPILYTGEKVVQGVGMIIAFLKAEDKLNHFITRSRLSHGWISGLTVSAKDTSFSDDFIEVVQYLKKHGLKIQVKTDGRNAHILKQLLQEHLVDRLIFNLIGPARLYEIFTGMPLSEQDLSKSLLLLEQCPDYQIILSLAVIQRPDNQISCISPEEASEAAAFVEQTTGRKTHPFYIKENISSHEKETLPLINLFKYRTACRRHMVKAEILKD